MTEHPLIPAKLRSTEEIKNHSFSESELAFNVKPYGPCGLFAAALITGADMNIIAKGKEPYGTTWNELARLLAAHRFLLIPSGDEITKDRLFCVSDGTHWIVVDTRNGFFARDATAEYETSHFNDYAISVYEVIHYDTAIEDTKTMANPWTSFHRAHKFAEELIDTQRELITAKSNIKYAFFAGASLGLFAAMLIIQVIS